MALNFPSQSAGQGGDHPAPPQPEQAGAPPKRKRVTQRLVLGAQSDQINPAESSTGRIRLPGATEPKADLPVQGTVQGEVNLPAYELLQCIPAEFLLSDHESLFASEQAQTEVPIPLMLILPGLPSGKIEIPIAELSGYMPEGMVKPEAELGEYAYSPIKLPLQTIIPRIPQEYLVLRYDQKPIDNTVTDLEDPFSLEALQAAALEKQESEMSADATMSAYEESSLTMEEAPEEPVEESVAAPEYQEPEDEEPIEEAMQPSAAIDAEMEPTVPMKDAGDEGMTGPGPEGDVPADAAETLPVPEIPTAEPVEEPDLSFAKSEAFRQFLEENDGSDTAPEANEIDPELAVTEIIEPGSEEASPVAPDFPPQEESPEVASDEESALPAPEEAASELIPQVPDLKPAPASKTQRADSPPKFHFKAPASSQSLKPKSDFKMPRLGKPRASAEEKAYELATNPSISKTSKIPSPAARAVVDISDSLKYALRLTPNTQVTLRDIVHQINCWPGMEGCILGGKDGLTITSEIEDERFGNTLSAFAPKILSRLNELFQDLGFDQVEEIQTPMDSGSVFIFRYEELFFIALSEESTLPASYRQLIKEIITELAKQKTI
jgi:predicted regulator of Ras-like GTPase activity (Roadblock/LC7/MglB family)